MAALLFPAVVKNAIVYLPTQMYAFIGRIIYTPVWQLDIWQEEAPKEPLQILEVATHKKTTASLDPGVYCGGLDNGTKSEITLRSGTYVFKDVALSIKSEAAVVGEGVAIYLTGKSAVLDFMAKSSLTLTAPTSRPLAGLLLFQDRDFGGTHDWQSKVPNAVFYPIALQK